MKRLLVTVAFLLVVLPAAGLGAQPVSDDATRELTHKWVQLSLAGSRVDGNIKQLSDKETKILYEIRRRASDGDIESQYYLGLFMYLCGKSQASVDSFIQAAQWWQMAADGGDDLSQYHLGVAYMNGEGVKRDFKKGLYWLNVSADKGDKEAANYLHELGVALMGIFGENAEQLGAKKDTK